MDNVKGILVVVVFIVRVIMGRPLNTMQDQKPVSWRCSIEFHLWRPEV